MGKLLEDYQRLTVALDADLDPDIEAVKGVIYDLGVVGYTMPILSDLWEAMQTGDNGKVLVACHNLRAIWRLSQVGLSGYSRQWLASVAG